jgi:hypothetical protein
MKAPQPSLFDRHEAAEAAALSAGATWKLRALDVLREYLGRIGSEQFTAERLVAFANGRDFQPPPDARAWGAVLLAAKRAKLVERTGSFDRDRFGSPKSVWRRRA